MGKTSVLLSLVIAAPAPLFAEDGAQSRLVGVGDVPFELVGQVLNTPGTPPTSLQFGYLSAIEGLDGIFTTTTPSQQNVATALFTFFNDSVTQRVIVHGDLRIINRVGTSTIYFDDTPDGNFLSPDPASFADGLAIQTSNFRHQVILDAKTNTFTTVFVSEVTSVEPFDLNGERFRLGSPHDKLTIAVSGRAIVPQVWFEIAGYAVEADRGLFDRSVVFD